VQSCLRQLISVHSHAMRDSDCYYHATQSLHASLTRHDMSLHQFSSCIRENYIWEDDKIDLKIKNLDVGSYIVRVAAPDALFKVKEHFVITDEAEEAYSSLYRPDGKVQLTDLFRKYSRSCAQIGEIISYRQRYEDYREQGLDRDILFKELEPRLVQESRKNNLVRFEIRLSELPRNHFESKVFWISIGLFGARSSNPFIRCILEHLGDSEIKLRDGNIIHRIERPRKAFVNNATTTEDEFNRILPDISARYFFLMDLWGRSPITTWFLSLEEDQLENNQVDLSDLSVIRIAIYYEMFTQ
jgi:hypothetical protein